MKKKFAIDQKQNVKCIQQHADSIHWKTLQLILHADFEHAATNLEMVLGYVRDSRVI